MKIIIFILFLISNSFALTLKFAAFTGVRVCQKHEGTNYNEICSKQLNYEPNVSIVLLNGKGTLVLNQYQYDLDIVTKVNVVQKNKKFNITLKSVNSDNTINYVNELKLTVDSIEDINRILVTGSKICIDESCTKYLFPFLYLGQPFIE
ncbi:MAG: hypothetical protein N4A33_00925 [Bacteriovoracaceae bacterium]|jgi:hypothetical protein|nr:hypothetical protein [Bacteriovoracaceae bacterium]